MVKLVFGLSMPYFADTCWYHNSNSTLLTDTYWTRTQNHFNCWNHNTEPFNLLESELRTISLTGIRTQNHLTYLIRQNTESLHLLDQNSEPLYFLRSQLRITHLLGTKLRTILPTEISCSLHHTDGPHMSLESSDKTMDITYLGITSFSPGSHWVS